jgi:hypothetical protein
VTAGDEITRVKWEIVTHDAISGAPTLSSIVDTEVYVYYGSAGATETNGADTWNADYGVVYHLKEDPAGTAPQAKDSTANAAHGPMTSQARPSRTYAVGRQIHPLRQRPAFCASTTIWRLRTLIGSRSKHGSTR